MRWARVYYILYDIIQYFLPADGKVSTFAFVFFQISITNHRVDIVNPIRPVDRKRLRNPTFYAPDAAHLIHIGVSLTTFRPRRPWDSHIDCSIPSPLPPLSTPLAKIVTYEITRSIIYVLSRNALCV